MCGKLRHQESFGIIFHIFHILCGIVSKIETNINNRQQIPPNSRDDHWNPGCSNQRGQLIKPAKKKMSLISSITIYLINHCP